MNQLVTPSFLFRLSIPAVHIPALPRATGRLLDLPEACRLPSLSELDSRRDFADIRIAWNDNGLGISLAVSGKSKMPVSNVASWPDSDGLSVWIDTRNTQGVHRATRYCHQFCLLPIGGKTRNDKPAVIQVPLARAREESAPMDLAQVQLSSEVDSKGYWLEAWFPASAFIGFDPMASPKLGFHYKVQDRELGEQSLVIQSEFPVASDPSLWQTIELVRQNSGK